MAVYMRKRINVQLAFFTLFVILTSVFVMSFLFYDILKKQVFEDLRINANVIKNVDETRFNDFKDLRITKISSSGVVLFDNNANVGDMDNHAYRPEVEEAQKNGFGRSARRSRTLNHNTFYYALRLDDGAVLRVAHSAANAFGIITNAIPVMIVIVGVMLMIIVICTRFVTAGLIRPIVNMTKYIDDVSCVEPVYNELLPFVNTIREQHENILKSAKMRQDFTANVSHELKTPLTAISGYAELIENGLCNANEIVRFSHEIRHNSQRLLSLINDIIKLSELDSMNDEITFEIFDLCDVVSKCVDVMKVNAQRCDVSINFENTGNKVELNANREMITELIYNLCDNAIRYNNKKGRVDVYVECINDKKRLIVADTGIGISQEHQERVFERFYRVDKSRSRQSGGTGLGLAIVKHIVALHNATIQLSSFPGKGTKIVITF